MPEANSDEYSIRSLTLSNETLTFPPGAKAVPVVDFDVESYRVADERALRTEADAMAATAQQVMGDLNDKRRAALVSLISEALSEISDNVEDWLADALVAQRDEKIGITILFKLGNLDDQILRLRAAEEAERHRRIADLERISRDAVATPG